MIEPLTLLAETPGAGIAKPTYAARYATGAEALSAESAAESFGDLDYASESTAVRIARTPNTADHASVGDRVDWRGHRWTIERRVESQRRMSYDLLLARAA